MSEIVIADKKFSLLLTSEKIQQQIELIAELMNDDLKNHEVIFIGILNGAFMFAADLLKRIQFNAQVSFVKVSSYQGLESGAKIKRLIGIDEELKGKTVVILEDIIDTGRTIEDIIQQIKGYRPEQIRIASLLLKHEIFRSSLTIDYVGFKIPNRFVIGYGLDYLGYGRNLRNIYVIEDTD